MTEIVVMMLMASLAENLFPLLNGVAMLGLVGLYFFRRRPEIADPLVSPVGPVRFAKRAYVYWLLSYVLTTAPLKGLLAFDFLRRDGGILIAYLPLLVFVDFGVDAKLAKRAITFFLGILTVVAMIGTAEFVAATVAPSSYDSLPEWVQLVHYTPLADYLFHGLFQAHNATGSVYAIAGMLALSMLLFGNESPRIVSRMTFSLAMCVMALLLSKSRTAYVAFGAASLLFFLSSKEQAKRILKTMTLVGIPILVLWFSIPQLSHRAGEITTMEDQNVLDRFLYWQLAADFIQKSPIVGIGFGRFNDENLSFSGYQHLVYVATGGDVVNAPWHAHNSYLHFTAEGGLIGLFLMLAIWVSTFRWALQVQRNSSQGTLELALAKAIQGCVIMEFLLSFTEHTMGTAMTSLTIFSLVGLLRNLTARKYRLTHKLTERTLARASRLRSAEA
jgi:O-antigen ligase